MVFLACGSGGETVPLADGAPHTDRSPATVAIAASESVDARDVHTRWASATTGAHVGWLLEPVQAPLTYPLRLADADAIERACVYLLVSSGGTIAVQVARSDRQRREEVLGVGRAAATGGELRLCAEVPGGRAAEPGWQYYVVLQPTGASGDRALHAEVSITRSVP